MPFALRGVGLPGVPGVAAELADPNAKPNRDFEAPVDAALRLVMVGARGGRIFISYVRGCSRMATELWAEDL